MTALLNNVLEQCILEQDNRALIQCVIGQSTRQHDDDGNVVQRACTNQPCASCGRDYDVYYLRHRYCDAICSSDLPPTLRGPQGSTSQRKKLNVNSSPAEEEALDFRG